MRLSALIGMMTVTESGRRLGEVFDIRVRPGTGEVMALLVGQRGLRERLLGGGPRGRKAPGAHHEVLPWGEVVRVEEGRVVVTDDAPTRRAE